MQACLVLGSSLHLCLIAANGALLPITGANVVVWMRL
nr:MAG TPA: hypothetical protein [Caudoviricetes sp.]